MMRNAFPSLATCLLTVLVVVLLVTSPAWSAELVLYLPFDEAQGEVAADISGNGHDAAFEGDLEWADGKFGSAIQFDGASHLAVQPSDKLNALTKDFSVGFWVKRDDQQAGTWNYMVAAAWIKWAIIYNSDQNVYVWASNPGWAQQAVTSEPLPDDWTHIGVTFDTNDAVKIRFNGEVVGESAGSPAETIPIDQCYGIGAIIHDGNCPSGEQKFTGLLDNITIYQGILSDEEIARDMDGADVGGLAVAPGDHLTTTWAKLKR